MTTIDSVLEQIFNLQKRGLNPTMIVVGRDTFRTFICDAGSAVFYDVVRRPPSLMGIRLCQTIDDMPFTVLSDGSSM